MKEQPINFETAKLAKKVEFPQNLFNTSWYNSRRSLNGRTDLGPNGEDFGRYPTQEQKEVMVTDSYQAPTQSLLQKWLREEHNIHVWVIPHTKAGMYYGARWFKSSNSFTGSVDAFQTYELALEEALQKGLNLL